MAILREKIGDNRFLILVEGLLTAGYLEDWTYHRTHSGSPQGGVISPILANIYLDRLDRFVEGTLIPEFTRGEIRRLNKEYQALLKKIRRRRARGQIEEARELAKVARTLPTIDPRDSDYRRLRYVRYADDFLLAFCGPRAEAEEIKGRLAAFLRDQLKLELSREKTLISHARTQPARFLGYEIAILHSDSYRTLNGQVDLRLPSDVLQAKCDRYTRGGKPIHLAGRAVASDFSIVEQYGLEYRGIVQYYALARNIRWLGRLHWVMGTSLLKTLANKHKSTVSQMSRKYGSKAVTSNGLKTCLRVAIEREGKEPLVAQFGGIPLQRSRRAILDDVPVTPFLNKRSEIERRLLADACEVCGSTERVQVHHVRKLADLKERGRRQKPGWVMQMAALRRKTLAVCEKCHVDIHAGRPLRKPTSS